MDFFTSTSSQILLESPSRDNLKNAPEFQIDFALRSGVLVRTPTIRITNHGGKYYDRHLSMVAFCAVVSSWLGQYIESTLITKLCPHRRCKNTYSAYVESNPRQNLENYECFPSCVVVVVIDCEHFKKTVALASSTLCYRSLSTVEHCGVLNSSDFSTQDFGGLPCPVSVIYEHCVLKANSKQESVNNDPRFLFFDIFDPLNQ